MTKGYRRYIRVDHGWLRHWYAAALDLKFLAAARPYWQDFGNSGRQCILKTFASLTPSHANFQGRNKVQGQHLMSRSTGATVFSDRAGFWRPASLASVSTFFVVAAAVLDEVFMRTIASSTSPVLQSSNHQRPLSLFIRVSNEAFALWHGVGQVPEGYLVQGDSLVTLDPCAAPAAQFCSTAKSRYCQYIYRHATRAPISTSARRRRAPTSSDMRSQNRVVKFPTCL